MTVYAHPTHDGEMSDPLHVDDSYASCFFDLHSELTQDEFDEFAGEAGAVMRFHQVADARLLGPGNWDVGLQLSSTAVDDAKGAWNNTMSHPTEDHYLGHDLAFPRIVVRLGVSEWADVGVWGSLDPNANYGFIGLESKVALLKEGIRWPVSVSLRPNATVLLGPDEMWAGNSSVDLALSRSFHGVSPYLGVGASASMAVETSKDVDLDNGLSATPLAFAGLDFRWKALSLGAQVERSDLTTYSFRAGGSF